MNETDEEYPDDFWWKVRVSILILIGLPVMPMALLMWPFHKALFGTEPKVRDYIVICAATTFWMFFMLYLPMRCK